MLIEWAVALGVFFALLALLPLMLRRMKRSTSAKGGGSGVFIAVGLVLAMIFDPKSLAGDRDNSAQE